MRLTREWRRLPNWELYDHYSSPNISLGDHIKNEIGGTYSTYKGYERCIQGSGGETGGKETTWKT